MLPQSIECLIHKLTEFLIHTRIKTSQQVHIFTQQLEWCTLKLNVSWRVSKHEAKINVHNMTIIKQKDVTIMSIFNIQDISDQRVSHKTLHKLALSILKRLRCYCAIGVYVMIKDCIRFPLLIQTAGISIALHRVHGYRIWNSFNQTSGIRCDQYAIKQNVGINSFLDPDILHLIYQLQSQLFLPEISANFHNTRQQPPVGMLTILRLSSYSIHFTFPTLFKRDSGWIIFQISQ